MSIPPPSENELIAAAFGHMGSCVVLLVTFVGIVEQHDGIVIALIFAVVVVDHGFEPAQIHFIVRCRHQQDRLLIQKAVISFI